MIFSENVCKHIKLKVTKNQTQRESKKNWHTKFAGLVGLTYLFITQTPDREIKIQFLQYLSHVQSFLKRRRRYATYQLSKYTTAASRATRSFYFFHLWIRQMTIHEQHYCPSYVGPQHCDKCGSTKDNTFNKFNISGGSTTGSTTFFTL